MIRPRFSFRRSAVCWLFAFLALAPRQLPAAISTWNGPGAGLNNWSASSNWSPAPPGSADDVNFFDTGAAGAVSNINNVVDATTNVASLHFGNTNGFHTTLIAAGQTLNLTGSAGLAVYLPVQDAAANTRAISATITGSGAALNLANSAASLAVNSGNTNNSTTGRATLDLSGLDTFTAVISRLGVGTTTLPNPASSSGGGSANQRCCGTLFLARTNLVALGYTDTLANYLTSGRNNALELGRNPGNPTASCLLYLGLTNAFFVDSIGVGRDKSSAAFAGWMGFNPAFTSAGPVAYLRGAAGISSRVTWWGIGDANASGSSTQVAVGTNDFSGGAVDALVDVLSLARDPATSVTAANPNIGVLTFTAGTIDVNTLYLGHQSLGGGTTAGNWINACIGIVNVNGANAALIVNSNLVLGSTTTNSVTATRTSGTLRVVSGSVRANSISKGAASTNNTVSLSGAMLTLTNSMGTPALGVTTFAVTNSMLNVFVATPPGINISVTNLVTGGPTNIVNFLSVPIFPVYPTQLTVIKYSGSISGAGYNFGLGTLPSPSTGFLQNNAGNRSIDLVLTSGGGNAVAGLYFQQQPSDTNAGSIISPAIKLVATNSVGATVSNVVVSIALLSGAGPLNGTLARNTDSAGVAAFDDLSLTAAGAKQLLAASGSAAVSSAPFNITPAAPAALEFTVPPSDVLTNTPISPAPAVQLRDAFNNNVLAGGLSVTMSLASGTGALTGATNVLTDSSGTASFPNLRLTASGGKRLAASAPGLAGATSASFNVTNTVIPTPAFRGAEGAGAYALGGRGGDIYYVTNLADSGAGSLRSGISGTPASGRTILFKVSGTIQLNSNLTINKSRLTIAGQTAPGDGIILAGWTTSIQDCHDVVVRFIRCRAGDINCPNFQDDSCHIVNGTNIVVDHVSSSWSVDESLSATWSTNVSVQWCIISESLKNSCHVKGAHGYGSLLRYGAGAISYHHNLYADHDSRNPRPGDNMHLDFVNNVVYNWGGTAGYNGDDSADNPAGFTNVLNYVGNYFIAGPSTTSHLTVAFDSSVLSASSCEIFQSGNFIDSNQNTVLDGANTGWSMFAAPYNQRANRYPLPLVTTDTAQAAWARVLAFAGASLARDAVDLRVTTDVRKHTGAIIDSQNSVGGYPTLISATPPADADSDGMPDFWELALGLNPSSAGDRNNTDTSGFTMLENYLGWLAAPHALCDHNGQADIDLRNATGGSTNLTYTVSNGTNGTVALLGDGHTARFTAAANYTGVADFTFNATDTPTAITLGATAVSILVTTTNAPTAPPTLSSPSFSGGRFSVRIDGPSGPDYLLLASSNLLNWTTLFISNSPTLPFTWIDPTSTNLGQRYYRIQLGP